MKKNSDRARQSKKVEERFNLLKPRPSSAYLVAPFSSEEKKASRPSISYSQVKTNNACLALGDQDGSIGALIFGSATRPGGGWRNGAVAQEEDVSLSSTWGIQAEEAPPGFYKDKKGWGSDKCLAARGAFLFDEFGYEKLSPLPCLFISIAAPNKKVPEISKEPKEKLISVLASRLETALNHWQKENIDTVVLGAIGCGVFEWDPVDSAEAFLRALRKTSFDKNIVFALPDPKFLDVFQKHLLSFGGNSAPKSTKNFSV